MVRRNKFRDSQKTCFDQAGIARKNYSGRNESLNIPLMDSIQRPNTADCQQILYSIDEVAIILGVERNTVYRIINSGSLPVVKFFGRGKRPITRIDEADLRKWISERKENPKEITDQIEAPESEQFLILKGNNFFDKSA
ncbi:MAG: helix-turn-helix domain-containing protein [Phycisphaerae bacterium]|nr:helix-turn-helix domain-containing protein [Phycisphaerae bacterium]